MKLAKVVNWSNTIKIKSKLFYPKSIQDLIEIIKVIKRKGEKISLIGSGNSYGDCIFNKQNIISTINLNKIIKLDSKKMYIELHSGCKIYEVLNFLNSKNFHIKSLPGSLDATIGGCISSNVHGKDSFKNGTFGNNVLELTVLKKNLKITQIRKKIFFNKYVGTYGINGIILKVKIKIYKIPSSIVEVKTTKFSNIDELINLFDVNKFRYSYLGAWVDHFSMNNRGIFQAANFIKSKIKTKNIITRKNNSIFLDLIYIFIRLFLKKNFFRFLNILIFNFYKNKKKNFSFSHFYFPQENNMPNDFKLFKDGKVNIQILINRKIFKKIFQEISYICKEYDYCSWWLGIKIHKKDYYYHSFCENGFDITLQWSKEYICKKNFKPFLTKLKKIIVNNKLKVYLTQDLLLTKKEYSLMYDNFLNKFNSKDKLINNFLFDRILSGKNHSLLR